MTQTFILGANGKLGSILAHFARAAGSDWRTQARSGTADVIWSGDFAAPSARQIFQPGSTIINMIGLAGGDEAIMHDINVHFVERLLKHAKDAQVAHVVLASSAAVYGTANRCPNREQDATQPTTPYGLTKVAMEALAKPRASAVGPAITLLRIGNVAGADALLAAARRSVSYGEPLTLHRLPGGTAPIRSYLGPRDLFDMVHSLSKPHSDALRIINVAHSQPVTLDAVLHAYRTHILPSLDWIDAPIPAGVPHNVTLATDTLQTFVRLPHYDDPANAFGRQVAEYLAQ